MNKEALLKRLQELGVLESEHKAKRSKLVDTAVADKRGLTEAEKAEFDAEGKELDSVKEQRALVEARLAEIKETEEREARAAESRRDTGNTDADRKGGATIEKEEDVYRADGSGFSFFRDAYRAQTMGDGDATARLIRQAQIEKRLPPTTGATSPVAANTGGHFAPPLWLINEYVELLRNARVAVDLFDVQPLPEGVSSINVPKVTSGTIVGVQSAELATLPEQIIGTGSLSTGIITVGGLQTVSQQLLDRSAIPMDRLVMEDLTAAYALEFNRQGLLGNGTTELKGLTNATGAVTVALTTTTAAAFYKAIADAIQRTHTARKLPPDTILMHPRRWAWWTSQLDANGRPFVVTVAQGPNNALGTGDNASPQGVAPVGTIQGLPVYVDASIPTNLGAGTNEDIVFVLRRNDVKVWESGPRVEAFRETFADGLAVLFRLYGYGAAIPDRYGTAVHKIAGAGLVAPTF